MKTLRMLRNIAVLFILVMALLGSRPKVGLARADSSKKSCGYKKGFSCFIDVNGNCAESHCNKSGGGFCTDSGCV
jgi:hypothetical protein